VIIKITNGDVVEIVLQNACALNSVAEFHPWHIHGHSFWVVSSGEGIYNESLIDAPLYNLENPILRDNVTSWPLQWVALRFVANNPGVWFFHRHITSHLIISMGFHMIVSPKINHEPSESVTSCSETSLEAGSNKDFTNSTDSTSTSEAEIAPNAMGLSTSALFMLMACL
jgi:Multicopper oxidase